jgi:ubiquinone/menaquinone biosynthesis C-methylase UbiE
MSEVLKKYYSLVADTYEKVFDKPERLEDLEELEEKVLSVLEGHKVLELACGTGYWTERIATVASSVYATDINQSMLDQAQTKEYENDNVTFGIEDLYQLELSSIAENAGEEKFTACFLGFTWSHIRRDDYLNVIAQCKKILGTGGLIVLIDNNEVEGNNRPIVRTDTDNNTYQFREKDDGTRVEVIKNFPTDSFMRKRLAPVTTNLRIVRNEYFWMLTCVLR